MSYLDPILASSLARGAVYRVTTGPVHLTDTQKNVFVGVYGLAGPLSISLPVAPVPGQRITVKDEDGSAATYPITVQAATPIDGLFTKTINATFPGAYGALVFQWTGLGWAVVDGYVASTDWRTMSDWSAWWADQMSLGPRNGLGGATSIQHWIDGTGGGADMINTDEPTPQNVPTESTLNGQRSALFDRTQQQVLVSADGAQGSYGQVFAPTAGYWIAAMKLTSILTDNANAFLNVGGFGDTVGVYQVGFRSTGPAMVTSLQDTHGFENTQATPASTSLVKVYESWWDGVNLYCRVSGGPTSSTPCLGNSLLGGVNGNVYRIGQCYDAFTGLDPNGYLDANVGMMAVRKGRPINANQIAAAIMAAFGAS